MSKDNPRTLAEARAALQDGGPAFPTSNGGSPDDGMTLRDYFAAKAMQGLIASMPSEDMAEVCDEPRVFKEHAADLATHAFLYADAMLKARQA